MTSTPRRTAGSIVWRPADPAAAQSELAAVLRSANTWPIETFAADWWSGDYRLVSLTVRRPADVEAVVRCHCPAGSSFTDIILSAIVRSRRRVVPIRRDSHAALRELGFGLSAAGEAELVHQSGPGSERDMADRILKGLSAAFNMASSVKIRYEIEQGTRLDEMAVFQNIRVHELHALLLASGFEAYLSDGSHTPIEPSISVRGGDAVRHSTDRTHGIRLQYVAPRSHCW